MFQKFPIPYKLSYRIDSVPNKKDFHGLASDYRRNAFGRVMGKVKDPWNTKISTNLHWILLRFLIFLKSITSCFFIVNKCAINVKECILHANYNNSLTFIAQKTDGETPLAEFYWWGVLLYDRLKQIYNLYTQAL
jgi:hypothetical protein